MAVNEILCSLEKRGIIRSTSRSSGLSGNSKDSKRSPQNSQRPQESGLMVPPTAGSAAASRDIEMESVRFSRREHLAYMLDQILSRRSAQLTSLGIFMLLQVIIGGVVWALVYTHSPDDPRDPSSVIPFFEGLWASWTFMADPGTHADVQSPEQRMIGASISFAGIITMAALLGIVVDVIRDKMDKLRQGKSKVVERGHSLILGWSEKAVLLTRELCIANASEGGGVIVILGSESKEHMETQLSVDLPVAMRYKTKIVLRTGIPVLVSDLIKVGAHTARSIAILSGEGDSDKADAETLRCMLSMRTLPSGFKAHIVAELRDIDNEGLVKMVGGSAVETIVSHDVLGRLMLMSVRQPGLAKVYESLLGFEGDEFYVQEWPDLVGVEWQDLIERFPDAIPIGIQRMGDVIINPEPSYCMRSGDSLIVIAEDDDSYMPMPPESVEVGNPPDREEKEQQLEKILLAGWRRDIRDILISLDNLCKRGSELHMVSHSVPLDERDDVLAKEGLCVHALRNIVIVHYEVNTTVRRQLVDLPLDEYTSCMIFADKAFEADTMQADSHSLATLLLVRDLQASRREAAFKEGRKARPVGPAICEILDPRTQRTIAENAHVSNASEFCQTNKLIAQIVAMVCENRTVKMLLDKLLGGSQCSVAVHPATRYVHKHEHVSFWTLAKRAMLFNEIVIGYHKSGASMPVILNPKDKQMEMLWAGFDMAVIGPADKGLARDSPARMSFKSASRLTAAFNAASGGTSDTRVTAAWSATDGINAETRLTAANNAIKPINPPTRFTAAHNAIPGSSAETLFTAGQSARAEIITDTDDLGSPVPLHKKHSSEMLSRLAGDRCDTKIIDEELEFMNDDELRTLESALGRLKQAVSDKVADRAVRANCAPSMVTKLGLQSKPGSAI